MSVKKWHDICLNFELKGNTDLNTVMTTDDYRDKYRDEIAIILSSI